MRMIAARLLRVLALIAAFAAFGTAAAQAAGPLAVSQGEYKFTALDEPLVATDRKIDLWATVWRPTTIAELGRPLPLLVFLHGNHSTCGRFDASLGVRVDDNSQYTQTGTCPSGYEVTPNHAGYDYVAAELASYGYVVVSINANRGITAGSGVSGDSGLNLMRGRLVLRHLALLADWNAGGSDSYPVPGSLGFAPAGTLDFRYVGLMGHSRGGEGVRAALQQYRDPGSALASMIGPMSVRSIFEIGPVDGQTSRVLNADGVASIILLPSCDGDVSDLQGVHVFDRAFDIVDDRVKAFHGTFTVWGANHNAYNTEWLTSDSPGCKGSDALFPEAGRSEAQQTTAKVPMVDFFRSTVGGKRKPALAQLFDPARPIPAELTAITRYWRGYLPGPINRSATVLQSFSGASGTSDSGVANTAAGVTVTHKRASSEHDASVRVAQVAWTAASPAERYYEIVLDTAGLDLRRAAGIGFRVSLNCVDTLCDQPSDPAGDMDFTVSLVDTAGNRSAEVAMAGRAVITRPVGVNIRFLPNKGLHPLLSSVELPIDAFTGVSLKGVKAIRFTFQKKPVGSVNLADIVALGGKGVTIPAAAPAIASEEAAVAALPPAATDDVNAVVAVTSVPASARGGAGGDVVAVTLRSSRRFPVADALPVLHLGDSLYDVSEIAPDGREITFRIPAADYARLPARSAVVTVRASDLAWAFGTLPR